MSGRWDPHQFKDSFKHEILALVDRKVRAGQLHAVGQPAAAGTAAEEAPIPFGAQILDLTDLLQRSLRQGAGAAPTEPDGTDDTRPPSPRRRRAA
jgi:DNA end-binding protein Ku